MPGSQFQLRTRHHHPAAALIDSSHIKMRSLKGRPLFCEVPQRQQLQSIHRLLNVPPVATVKLGNAYQFVKFGTGNSLLRYGIVTRCAKQPSLVRDAFSEAFGVKNRLLRYGRDIRCQKQASLVRDASSKTRRTASCRSGRSFSARNGPRSEVSRHKKRVYSLEIS